ncbi:hypothetical protein LCDV1gp059 [Lymphocystis disease virus 1]|uniref:hypothetical protein n=1 Tax=Fish lymphocystis disease virus TaxID=36363 RepID=UPI0000161ED4|nr:hypothetical protein LCDV1gp059 [Lymphocystis disease virus 1]
MTKQIKDLATKLATHLNNDEASDTIATYIITYLKNKNLSLRGSLLADLSSSSESDSEQAEKSKLVKTDLETMTIANLREICKKMNLKTSGNKANLVERLLEAELTANIIPPQKLPIKIKTPKRPVVFEKITSAVTLVPLDDYKDLLYDMETKLVFEKSDPDAAIGTYADGHIFGLTTSSMEICKSKGLNYVWPSNITDNA